MEKEDQGSIAYIEDSQIDREGATLVLRARPLVQCGHAGQATVLQLSGAVVIAIIVHHAAQVAIELPEAVQSGKERRERRVRVHCQGP